MRLLGLLVCGLAVSLASAQIFDDFNRPDGRDLGPNWNKVSGDYFFIQNNQGRCDGGNKWMDWVGTPNTEPYYNVRASIDIYNIPNALNYVALRTGVGTDELFIKVQSQSPYGGFTHIGFYHRTSASGFGAWPGGTGFFTLPTKFDQARITTYFQPGNTDTLYIDIDTDFNGTPEFTYSSPGVNNIAANLGFGVGIGGYGSTTNAAMFDNFSVVPEPASLALLAVVTLLRRR